MHAITSVLVSYKSAWERCSINEALLACYPSCYPQVPRGEHSRILTTAQLLPPCTYKAGTELQTQVCSLCDST